MKKDGSDMFLEGDITGARDMYIAAMRLQTDQHIKKLLTPKQQGNDCNNNISDEDRSTERRYGCYPIYPKVTYFPCLMPLRCRKRI